MKITSESEYQKLKEEYLRIEEEQRLLSLKLSLWERTRPENIERTKKMLNHGYDVDVNTGLIYSMDENKQSLINIGQTMSPNYQNICDTKRIAEGN